MTIDLKALREAAERATPGPWQASPDYYRGDTDGWLVLAGNYQIVGKDGIATKDEDDAAFIALANPATILSLIEELAAAKRDAERYRWLRQDHDHGFTLPYIANYTNGHHSRWTMEHADAVIDAAIATREGEKNGN